MPEMQQNCLLEASFADAVARISRAEDLKPERRGQLVCSLRVTSEMLGRPPELIPARWSAVRQALSERAVELLLKKIPAGERAECLRRLFDHGRSLGWITSLLRSEIFAHGYYGHRSEPEEQRLLTVAEFEHVRA